MTKVVVYGSLKKGFGNSCLLENSKLLHDKVFFTGTMASLGGFPCCTQHGNTRIQGEMYEVDDTTLARLDQLEGHPNWYERKMVSTSEGEAWIYFIDRPDHYGDGARIVKSGVWEGRWKEQEQAA